MKRFTAQHTKGGFAAMGGNMKRPRYKGMNGVSIADAIARERASAARQAAIKRK